MSEESQTQVLVWRYGARKGAEIPEEVDRQLRLAHELREELVAIAHRREQAVERVWAEHPAVSDAQRELARADAALERLLEQASEERMRRRERKVSRELREQITTARRKFSLVRRRIARNGGICGCVGGGVPWLLRADAELL